VDLLYPYRHLDFPPGYLFVHDQDMGGSDPTADAFAQGRVQLYYLEST
jgi:hypothetical protein